MIITDIMTAMQQDSASSSGWAACCVLCWGLVSSESSVSAKLKMLTDISLTQALFISSKRGTVCQNCIGLHDDFWRKLSLSYADCVVFIPDIDGAIICFRNRLKERTLSQWCSQFFTEKRVWGCTLVMWKAWLHRGQWIMDIARWLVPKCNKEERVC